MFKVNDNDFRTTSWYIFTRNVNVKSPASMHYNKNRSLDLYFATSPKYCEFLMFLR